MRNAHFYSLYNFNTLFYLFYFQHFIVAVLGAILLFVVAILILEYVSRYPNFADRIIFIRLVFAGVLSLVLSGAFVMNALLFVLKEEGW